MGQTIFTRVWLATVGVTRPYPAGTLSSTGSTTEISSSTLTKVRWKSTEKSSASEATGSTGGELESADEQPWTKSSSLGKRQLYTALHEPSGQPYQHSSTTQAMSTPTSTSGSYTKGVEGPTSTPSRNLVPHWDYRSHSIAVACILIIVFAVSILVLLALYIKKVHNFCRRRKRERRNYSPPKYSSYDSPVTLDGNSIPPVAKVNEDEKSVNPSSTNGTHSFDTGQSRPPSPGFVVEEDPTRGSVVRVYRAVKNKMPKNSVTDTLPALSPPRGCSFKKGQVTNRASDETIPTEKTCSAEKPVVVVPPPLTHTPSMCATRETHSSPGGYTRHGGNSDLESSDEGNIRYSDPGPEPHRVSYLPRIYQSGLPLFNLEGLRFD